MMDHHLTVVLAIVAGIVGFAGYCVAAAFHVWRSRNRDSTATIPRIERFVKRVLLFALVAGAVSMFVVLVQQFVIVREGVLQGENLSAVRARDGFEVVWITSQDAVQEGEVLMRLHSSEVESAIDVRRLKLEEIRSDITILKESPLALDGEVVRALSAIDNEQLYASARRDENKREQARVGRELARTQLDVQDQINRLDVELAQLDRQLAQAQAVLEFNQGQLMRSEELRGKGAVSKSSHDEWIRKAKVAEDEVNKLKARTDSIEAQKTDLEQNLHSLAVEMKKQSTDFLQQIDQQQERLDRAAVSEDDLRRRVDLDRQRAARIRQHEIEQLRIRSKQLEAEIGSFEQSLEIKSSIAGRVVYRAASPRNANSGETLLVVAPENGLRFRVRLPDWQRAALEETSEVQVEFSDQVGEHPEIEATLVTQRFTGSFVQWQELAAESSHGLAVLKCDPPPETGAFLASGRSLPAQVTWRPGINHNPLFVPACATFGVAFILLLGIGLIKTRRFSMGVDPELEDVPIGASEPDSAVFKHIGREIREMILRDVIRDDVLARAESALERHPTLASRHIARQLIGDEVLRLRLSELIRQEASELHLRSGSETHDRQTRRLFEIVGRVNPSLILFEREPREEETDLGYSGRLYGP